MGARLPRASRPLLPWPSAALAAPPRPCPLSSHPPCLSVLEPQGWEPEGQAPRGFSQEEEETASSSKTCTFIRTFCRSSLGRSGLFPLLTGPKSGFLLCFRSLGVCVRNCQDCSAQRTGGALGASAVLRPGLPRRRLPRRRAGSGRPGVILAQRPRASPENALPWGSSWPGAGQALQLDALPGPP